MSTLADIPQNRGYADLCKQFAICMLDFLSLNINCIRYRYICDHCQRAFDEIFHCLTLKPVSYNEPLLYSSTIISSNLTTLIPLNLTMRRNKI